MRPRFGIGATVAGVGLNVLLAIIKHPPHLLYFVAWGLIGAGVLVCGWEVARRLRAEAAGNGLPRKTSAESTTEGDTVGSDERGPMSERDGHDQSINITTHGQIGHNIGKAERVSIGAPARSLAQTDSTGLRSAANAFAGTQVTVVAAMGDGESVAFAHEIAGLLRDCGWTVQGPDQAMSMGPPIDGVELRAPADDESGDAPPWLERLGRELLQAGFRCRGLLGHSHAEIRVGRAT